MKWLLDFFVGDDWRLALGAFAALGIAAALVGLGVDAWWAAPPVAIGALWLSLRRALQETAAANASSAAGATSPAPSTSTAANR